MNRLAGVLRMIKFEHTVFALPFALAGAWIAAAGPPPWRDLGLIVLAAVAARSAAMSFNRVADRFFDAHNPRTAERELVTGALSVPWTVGFTAGTAVIFVGASFALAPVCGWLSLPVLVVLLGYSYLKRFTLLCHFGLGLALACAPTGAWLAVAKEFRPGWEIPLVVGLGVVAWVSGFDLLYALQDREVDRRQGLHSVPARHGVATTQQLARGLHGMAVLLFATAGLRAGFGAWYMAGVVGVAVLLASEHHLVRGGRLDRIPLAFFRVNAWVGVVFFAGVAADYAARGNALLGS